MDIKILRTDEERAKGLQGVKHLPYNSGALFVYDVPQVLFFWGGDTYIPLDIAFIDSENTIIKIDEIEPHSKNPVSSLFPALYALEMNRGWFKENGFKPGDKFPIKNKKASTDVVKYVLSRLPIDIYEVVKDIPVNIQSADYIRGEYNNGAIELWDDGSDSDYLQWTLAHEYWHAFIRSGDISIHNGLGRDIFNSIKEKIENSYYDDERKRLAREFIARHLTMGNIKNAEAALYEEMFADGLADLVIGGDMTVAIESYANYWVQNYIYEKFGALNDTMER